MPATTQRPEVILMARDPQRGLEILKALASVPDLGNVRSLDPEEWDLGAEAAVSPGRVIILSATGSQDRAVRELAQRLRSASPAARILVVDIPVQGDGPLSYLESGAWGTAMQGETPERLAAHVQAVRAGEAWLTPLEAGCVVERIHELVHGQSGPIWDGSLRGLTAREQEVLGLLRRRMTNRQIAEELVLEVGTVKNHVHHVLKKLQVENREMAVEAVAGLASFPQEGSDE